MFGYVRPQASELLVREYEQYKGVYCSLCKELGKQYGILSRFTLSYDCTFLSLFLMALDTECIAFRKGRCRFNPMKSCTYCGKEHLGLGFSSAVSVLLAYYKVQDDLHDSGFFGKLRAYLMLPWASRVRRKARKKFPEVERILQETIAGQAQVEQEHGDSLDACAEPTAQMLSRIFGLLAKPDEPNNARILESFGYFLGRWIYLMDAADDLERDFKKKVFNPFLRRFRWSGEVSPEAWEQARADCNEVLNLTLSQVVGAVNLLDFPNFRPIILNIILQGLPNMQKNLLLKKEKHDVRSV